MTRYKLRTAVLLGAAILSLAGLVHLGVFDAVAAPAKGKRTLKINAEVVLQENLRHFKGKYIQVILTGGRNIDGDVTQVSDHTLVLKMTGDLEGMLALVKIDDISSVLLRP